MKAFQRTDRVRRLSLGAACIAGLAGAPAQAAIISSGIVDHVVSTVDNYYNLDVNGNSANDLAFFISPTAMVGSSNGRWVWDGMSPNPLALSLGTLIDSTDLFVGSKQTGGIADGTASLGWPTPYPTAGIMGVRLWNASLDGYQYGWIEITATASDRIVLNQWAYQDQKGVGILAGEGGVSVPEPGSALLLLSGLAAGVARARRKG